jgi:hypothetical protein
VKLTTAWHLNFDEAHHAGRLQQELLKLGRVPLLVIDLCRPREYADNSRYGLRNPLCGGAFGLADAGLVGIVPLLG